MQKLITVVVPTYNMQDYLTRCLDSLVINDEYLMGLLEVIIVNDGSSDMSSAIGHRYEDMFPRTFYVIDKDNGNYGSCINRGLAEAKGKYVKILDADDWFDTKEFVKYLTTLQKIDGDMILTDYQIVDDNGSVRKKMSYDIEKNKYFAFQELTDAEIYFSMHSITYRTEMLRKFGYHQTEGISYTDTEWVFYPQHKVKTCIYLPFDVYRYVLGREGQTMDAKVLVKSVSHYDKLLRAMVLFADNLSESDKQLYSYQRIEAQIEHLSMGVYRTCLVLQDADSFDNGLIKSFDSFMCRERPKIYKHAGKLVLKSFFPIHYVLFWRFFGKRFPVNIIRNIYRTFQSRNIGLRHSQC